jgi:hypothetical protein
MKLLRTISAFTLALLVLISSSSFMVNIHLCAGKVQDMALFSEAEKCAMEKSLPPCHKHLAAPCCDDETVVHEAEGFKASFLDVSIAPAPVVDLHIGDIVLSEIIPSSPTLTTDWQYYDPPLRSHDLTVSQQVFRI